MMDIRNKLLYFFLRFFKKYEEAIYVTKKQYKVRFVQLKKNKQGKAIAMLQVANKRSKITVELGKLNAYKAVLNELHPVDACRLAFLSHLNKEDYLDRTPGYITAPHNCPILHAESTVQIESQQFDAEKQETIFHLRTKHSSNTITLSALELVQNHQLLCGLDLDLALQVGHAAGHDFSHQIDAQHKTVEQPPITSNLQGHTHLKYYHVLCVLYVGLGLAGISIIKRLFPFHIPFTHYVVPLGAGIIFFPLVFAIQDITTEVYGFAKSRHMVWLSLFVMILFIGYTQLAIHLPSSPAHLYHDNADFAVVFNNLPRQFISLAVSLLISILINDFLISRLKIKFGGRYLWARIVFSTMIGEAVLNVVGLIIGFGNIMNFYTQILPNMALAYGYKQLWNVALIPVIYLITSYLKRKEGIDIYDYDTNYNPFILK